MSNFWTTSTGENLSGVTTAETGGGNIEPIPSDTNVLAVIEDAKIDNYKGNQYVSLRWRVAKPAEFNNRVVFQKVKVWDDDTGKRDKARRMLAAIDGNAGGKLQASGQEPNDLTLQSLLNRPMVLNLQVWKMDGKQGNWVSMISPRTPQTQQPAAQPQPQTAVANNNFNDEMPF